MMFWYDHDMGWWGYTGMWIGMVLFWTLVIVGIVALVRASSGPRNSPTPTNPPPPQHSPSPEEILAGRFAHGEIDEAEYQNRLRVIREHGRG